MPTSIDISLSEVEGQMLALTGPTDVREADTSATLKAVHYHLNGGGQRVRAHLALHACRALGVKESDAVLLAAAAELLHNASLVHDDLHDQETLRRGQPTIWRAFGKDVAICAGDLLLSAAYGALAKFSDTALLPALLERIHNRTLAVIHGQCSELSAKDKVVDTVEAYQRIVIGKSGALLSLPLELACIAARLPDACILSRDAALAFGLGYQMLDDLEDLAEDTERQTLNIVLVLRASGAGATATTQAIILAQGHLNQATELAQKLPQGAGDLLVERALALGKRLRAV